MGRSDNIHDSIGIRCGVLAIALAITGIFIGVGVGLLVISLSLFFAGISGFLGHTILSTTAIIIPTVITLFIIGELNFVERSLVGIPYLFAVVGIIIGILRNRAQSQRISPQQGA